MDSIELIRTFLSDRLGVEPERVHDEAVLADLGVDSLMVAELMFEAEDRLNISIDNDEKPPVTVGDMRAIIERLQPSSSAEP
ncbi:phosphopantetheine-binding protein [Melaminivora suipulveris]|uniref:Phosphopantetheine-binding protein n=1 Tax=Melaminivora suipulveris TaxID=2109913 RepID=A0A2R3QC05_9BURK|nr:acyl carrier protein [Melaminivora suipulveris]AVO49316.1 phosphopantetheine-binding protein [Melaminivora suipulveris]